MKSNHLLIGAVATVLTQPAAAHEVDADRGKVAASDLRSQIRDELTRAGIDDPTLVGTQRDGKHTIFVTFRPSHLWERTNLRFVIRNSTASMVHYYDTADPAASLDEWCAGNATGAIEFLRKKMEEAAKATASA